MSVIRDTSHSPIGPFGPLTPFRDNFRNTLTVFLSSCLDRGENAGVSWSKGETAGLSSKFWQSYNESTSRFISRVRVWVRLGYTLCNTPPLQEFGDMLARSIRNRIESRGGKRICVCWCVALGLVVCVCVSVSVCVCVRVSVRECINVWITDPRAQPLHSDLIQS